MEKCSWGNLLLIINKYISLAMKKYIIGYTAGVFDMFHVGHLNILQRAKELCDYLVVGVASDELCLAKKHKLPIINEHNRMAIVEALRYVDRVVPLTDMDINSQVKEIGADIVFVAPDWKETEAWTHYELELAEVGCRVVYLEHTDGIFSTLLSEELAHRGGRIQDDKKVGYTTGVFDMFHIGHLNILRRAKEHCDYLIVGVSTDENVESYKHKTPSVPFSERIQIVQAIKYVDEVVAQENMDKYSAWERLHFDEIYHGDDWKGSSMYNHVEEQLEKVGCKTIYLPHTDGISSSLLREQIKS